MKRNKWICSLLCVGMMVAFVTGCSQKGTIKKSPSKTVKLEKGDITEDSIVIAVGSEGVRYSEVLNYSFLLKEQYENTFTEALWDYPVGDNSTIGEEAKQEIVTTITQLKVIKMQAEAREITLTNDEIDEALQKAESLLATVSVEDKKTYALSVQNLSDIYQDNILANKMFYIVTDNVDTNLTDLDVSDEEKEIIIKERQTNSFKKQYDKWLKKCTVKISDDFWDVFQL